MVIVFLGKIFSILKIGKTVKGKITCHVSLSHLTPPAWAFEANIKKAGVIQNSTWAAVVQHPS